MKKISLKGCICCFFTLFTFSVLWWQFVGFPVQTITDLPYGLNKGVQSQRLDLYLPKGTIGPSPLIVWIHGGSWWSGDKANPPFQMLLAHGYAGASINYRLSSEAKFPAQLDDCKEAIRWLRLNCHQYNIDPDRIGVWGASAGGHLAALVGVTGDEGGPTKPGVSSKVAAVCDFCGITDMCAIGKQASNRQNLRYSLAEPMKALMGATLEERMDLYKQASPVTYVNSGCPPFLIVHGKDDNLVPGLQSIELHESLLRKKVQSTLLLLDGAGHWLPEEAFVGVESFFNQTIGHRQ